MKKDGWGALVLASAGLLVGSTLEWLHGRKALKQESARANRNYDMYLEQLKRGNDLSDKVNELDLEVRQCKLTNWQVATYATQLKQRLDQFME